MKIEVNNIKTGQAFEKGQVWKDITTNIYYVVTKINKVFYLVDFAGQVYSKAGGFEGDDADFVLVVSGEITVTI